MKTLALRFRLVCAGLCAVVLAIGLGLAVGCSRDGGDEPSAPIDTALMAFLSQARALHHQADLEEQNGNVEAAAAAMEKLVGGPRPHPGRPAPEIDEVVADAYARLAELELKRGRVEAASRATDRGLEHAPTATYFRGHLVEVQGIVAETNAATLADAGRSDEAAREREHAIRLLEEAVKIQEDVIRRSLEGRDAGKEAPR